MLTRQQFRNELLQLWSADVGQLEYKGKNRSPLIDEINKTIGASLGSPYCIAGLLARGVKPLCEKYKLKNPVYMTAGTQRFYEKMSAFKKTVGEIGDIGIMQSRSDSSKGHAWGVKKKTSLTDYDSVEYNTDLSGDRDGDGVHFSKRDDDGDKQKRFRGFIDVVEAIAQANPDKFEQTTPAVGPSPVLAWDGRVPKEWTAHLYALIEKSKLPDLPMTDIVSYKRQYSWFSRKDRVIFWARLISKMAQYESSWKPGNKYQEGFNDSKGKPVISRGLLQMSIESLGGWGIKTNEQELHEPLRNLEIAVELMEKLVAKHGVISSKRKDKPEKWGGLAAYWSVMRPSSDSFLKIKTWV